MRFGSLRMAMSLSIILGGALIAPSASGEAAARKRGQKQQSHHHPVQPESESAGEGVGVDERLGGRVPLHLVFEDERGREARLGDRLGLPTLVLPVFYHCTQSCSLMLSNLATGINQIPLELGQAYRVLALSFDEEEGTEIALEAKENYTKILKTHLPTDAWSFLTGEREAIEAFTDAIGFRFKKTGPHAFIHPNVLVVLAPDGTIIRYLYGPRFLAFDMGMALTEAARGTPGLSVRKLLTYCFDYDPDSGSYVFTSLRIVALAIMVALAGLFIFVLRKKPKL